MKPCDNPFRSCRVDAVEFVSFDHTVEQLYENFCRMDYKAAIVGQHGRGKSTLLRQIAQRLNSDSVPARLIFINDTVPFTSSMQKSFIRDIHPDSVVLVDGIDQLGWFRRHRLLRCLSKKCRGILVVSHGRSKLPTLTECTSSPELLTQLVKTLLSHQSLPMIDNAMIKDIFQRHNGNIRNCLSELYDYYADK
ncbi:MAG: hypothetical protein KAS23_13450 [Anaerohalosphaera sp.]|nr:hypothetical protein [Anaerohalosphaera sp.]